MLVGLISLKLFTTQVLAAETEIGFSPEGSALQLVLNTINSSTESIRLMGYWGLRSNGTETYDNGINMLYLKCFYLGLTLSGTKTYVKV